MHDSKLLVYILSFDTLCIHIRQHSNTFIFLFFINYQNSFVQVGVVCTAWWHLRELSQQSNSSCIMLPHCIVQQTQNLDRKIVLTCFTKWLLSSHPWPSMNDRCTIWKKKYMPSSTDNNFMILSFRFWEI